MTPIGDQLAAERPSIGRNHVMTTPGRLSIEPDTGKVTGPANIHYNDPFPCVNGALGVTRQMTGVLMHTMVGNLAGTVASFNNPSFKASAHFGVGQLGEIWQFGPLGKGWEAWHAMAANLTWYGIEHADDGNPDNPLTSQQIVASAQLLELLSRFCGFPLQVTDSVAGRGYGTHSMGGSAWGGHTCPDLPPAHVRSLQRPAIVALAKDIRNPPPPWTHAAEGLVEQIAKDLASLHQLIGEHQ